MYSQNKSKEDIKFKLLEVSLKPIFIGVVEKGNKKITLNKNDFLLLKHCEKEELTINIVAKMLGITSASVCGRINKLRNIGLIKVDRKGKGKKTFIKTIIKIPEIIKSRWDNKITS